VFGETKSVITDAQGRKVGEAVAQKPNVFGEVRTVYWDANGKITGQAVTSKPNVFGEVKTKLHGKAQIESLGK
jgi:YD repeat-containing protein